MYKYIAGGKASGQGTVVDPGFSVLGVGETSANLRCCQVFQK